MDIKVEYDGEYPNSCSGTLKITVDGEEIYNEAFCCHSTGSVWFDDEMSEHVESGELLWNKDEDKEIPANIRKKVRAEVKKVLSRVEVCCGGCV